MAIIICPECNKQLSQYAEICPKCGFPIKKYMENHNLIDINKEFICPKCAYTYAGYGEDSDPIYLKCKYCDTPIVATEITGSESLNNFIKDNNFYVNTAKKYGNNQFSEEVYNKRLGIIKQENTKQSVETQPSTPQITCPTCSSTNVSKISTSAKVTNTVLFGIFGNKRSKQFHCEDCGYEW